MQRTVTEAIKRLMRVRVAGQGGSAGQPRREEDMREGEDGMFSREMCFYRRQDCSLARSVQG